MPNKTLPDSSERQPEEFAAVLATDEPLFLVGGQAVNLWALYYRERTAGLADGWKRPNEAVIAALPAMRRKARRVTFGNLSFSSLRL